MGNQERGGKQGVWHSLKFIRSMRIYSTKQKYILLLKWRKGVSLDGIKVQKTLSDI